MIDPLISLAYAMQTSKGVYALLIGSGVSRAAEIPTGWEIVLDLVDKLAHLHGEERPEDPAAWYRGKYDKEPDYSELLDAIAKSPEERQSLLARYFEPTEQDREDGIKQPTAAHTAIAQLVARGYVKVVVTTNFDRLIERAIEDAGVTPVVLSTPDAIEGALPLVHQRCTVLKVNGDYLDVRIKNTPEELDAYDPSVDSFLDRLIDEFGLVICGWSAQWDRALQNAFIRCKSRRFTTYWAAHRPPTEPAKRLIHARGGVSVDIQDANDFFTQLSERVFSLEDLHQSNPLSVSVAAATVKRLLPDVRQRIRLHDLIRQEMAATYLNLQPVFDGLLDQREQGEKFSRAMLQFEAKIELLRAMAVNGAYWGTPAQTHIFAEIPARLAVDPDEGRSGMRLTDSLRVIPSVMMLYVMGIASLSNDNTEMLSAILSQPKRVSRGERRPLLSSFDWPEVQRWFKTIEEHEHEYFPASEWLYTTCRKPLQELIPVETDYERLFNKFEIVRSLIYIDLERDSEYHSDTADAEYWGPPGRFVWKSVRRRGDTDLLGEVQSDETLMQQLCASGLFNGSTATLCSVIDGFRRVVEKMARQCW